MEGKGAGCEAKCVVFCRVEGGGRPAGIRILEVAHTRVSPGLSGLSASFLQGESGKTVFSEQREESKDWHNLSGRGIVARVTSFTSHG